MPGSGDDLTARSWHWRARALAARTPWLTRAWHRFVRRRLEAKLRRQVPLEHPALAELIVEGRFPLEDRRAMFLRHCDVRGKTLLLLGVGSGWEVPSWLEHKPARVIGVELDSFARGWKELEREGPVVFSRGALERLPLPDACVDGVASDSVLEHCADVVAVLREVRRVLRPGGFLWAGYGPLWFCWGGDHSQPQRLEDGYRHLAGEAPTGEGVHGGARLHALGRFSRLGSSEHLAAFREAGFKIVELRVEVSSAALAYRERWPEEYERLRASAVKAQFVVARR